MLLSAEYANTFSRIKLKGTAFGEQFLLPQGTDDIFHGSGIEVNALDFLRQEETAADDPVSWVPDDQNFLSNCMKEA